MDSARVGLNVSIKTCIQPRIHENRYSVAFLAPIPGALLFLLLVLGSCATPPPAALKDREGLLKVVLTEETRASATISVGLTSAERTPAFRFSVTILKDQPLEVELSSPYLPAFRFRGTLTFASEEEWVLQIVGAWIFDNWSNGWTEGEIEAHGTLVGKAEPPLSNPGQGPPQGARWRSILRDPLGLGEVKKGEIRYFDRYYRGEEGRVRVEHRIRRLRELVQGTGGKGPSTEGGRMSKTEVPRSPLQKPPKDRRELEVEENPELYVSLWNLDWFNSWLQQEGVILAEEGRTR